ncbi:hypothetical protein A2U01_0062687, partial [Trifolium medium]|nr:hypothetical protein [Trifolium medium]
KISSGSMHRFILRSYRCKNLLSVHEPAHTKYVSMQKFPDFIKLHPDAYAPVHAGHAPAHKFRDAQFQSQGDVCIGSYSV